MTETAGPPAAQQPTVGSRVGSAARGVLGLIGGVVRLITGLFAAILGVHILLVLFGANAANAVVQLVASTADALTLGLDDLFLIGDPVLGVIVGYGLPALAWLLIGSLVVALLRLIGRPRSGLA